MTLASARAKLTAVTITASAPAKLMLYGEHAVVYGVPCVVTAVDLRVRVSVGLRRDDHVTIRTPMLAEPFTTDIDASVAHGSLQFIATRRRTSRIHTD